MKTPFPPSFRPGPRPLNRREFIGQASCAAVGSTALFSTLLNLMLTSSAVAQSAPGFNDYKALVCLFLPGGNDSFNLLVPRDAASYSEYAAVRTDLALDQSALLPLNALNTPGRQFGLHPGGVELQQLFENERLAFIANVGSLVRPTSVADFNAGLALPYGVFSHSDQQEQWQSSLPDTRSGLGWAGRAADLLAAANAASPVSMNISISGNNLFQVGNSIVPYTVNSSGAPALNGYNGDWDFNPARGAAVDSQLAAEYAHVMERTYARMKRGALDAYAQYSAATAVPLPAGVTFPGNDLGASLAQVARVIAGRNVLGAKRQVFYVQWGGWDFHDEVVGNMARMIPIVSQAVNAFTAAMTAMGLGDSVTLFSASEFGRSLTSNARGSDHAWGGNQFVVGGAVKGRRIYGQYPALHEGSDVDCGRGRIIPTTAVDQYAAELALWLGVSKTDLPLVLPNISRFYNLTGSTAPLGFLL